MAKILKFIGLLIFAFALWQSAGNIFINQMVDEGIGAVDKESSVAYQQMGETCITTPKLPLLPDAELAGLSMQSQIMTSLRVQRSSAIECVFSLKDWIDMLALRDATMSLHREKLYDTSASYRCHPACEYYVFTLKRILI